MLSKNKLHKLEGEQMDQMPQKAINLMGLARFN